MDLQNAGLHKHTFRLHGKPLTYVPYESQDVALEFLHQINANEHGLGVLQGPSISGKSTVVQRFINQLPSATAVASVDCRNLDVSGFLAAILSQYGFELGEPSIDEQMNFLRVFLVQQASTYRAPLLFIENAQEMDSFSSHCLYQLMKARFKNENALRVVLISDCALEFVADAPAIIAHRQFSACLLGPMTEAETMDYLNSKLCAGGCDDSEKIVPWHLCKELFDESEGYPGLLDRLMMLRLQEAEQLPLRSKRPAESFGEVASVASVDERLSIAESAEDAADVPVLYITLNGKTLRQVKMDKPRLMIGRSNINDITIKNSFMSRHHAMLVRMSGATVLIDLNSTNGIFVNSKRVESQVLRHEDVISLGNHGIKIFDSSSRHCGKLDESLLDDTASMQILSDTRRVIAMTGTHAVHPVVSRKP